MNGPVKINMTVTIVVTTGTDLTRLTETSTPMRSPLFTLGRWVAFLSTPEVVRLLLTVVLRVVKLTFKYVLNVDNVNMRVPLTANNSSSRN